MKEVKKGLAMVIAYLMLVSVLPAGLVKASATAEGSVPKYLDYNDLYFTSVAQYEGKTLVTYKDTNYDVNYNNNYENFTQVSMFSSLYGLHGIYGETKVGQILNGNIRGLYKDEAHLSCYDENKQYYGMKYNFKNGSFENLSDDEIITDEMKKDIIDMINVKYSTSYDIEQTRFYQCGDISVKYDSKGNKYIGISVVANDGVDYYVIYNSQNSYVEKYDFYSSYIDNEDNLVILNDLDHIIKKVKDGKETKIGTIDFNNQSTEVFLTANGNYAFTLDFVNHQLKRYVLKDGTYSFEKVMFDNIRSGDLSCDSFGEVTGGNIWFVRSDVDGNFVYKIENGEAVKKYQVASFMKYVKVYDDNHLVVTSELGSTIINNEPISPVVIAPNISEKNENGTTTVVVDKLDSNSKNTINVNYEEKEVQVSINDVQAIKDGSGSLELNLSNGTKLNVPFSAIDKSLLEGATKVDLQYEPISNSNIVTGLKAVNKVFDFKLLVEYGDGVKSIHQFANGSAEITLALTDEELNGLNRANLKVLYYNEETKKYEVMETKVDGNNLTFTTSHFSKFIVAEVDANGVPLAVANNTTKTTTSTPSTASTASTTKTADTNTSINIFILGALAFTSLGIVTTLTNKRMKKIKVK